MRRDAVIATRTAHEAEFRQRGVEQLYLFHINNVKNLNEYVK
jgi:hypothetical protein